MSDDQGQEVVIVGPDGQEHVFPAGFNPKRAAGLVRLQTVSPMRRFVGGAAEMLNPVTIVKGMAQMALHPRDTYEGLVQQSADQFTSAREAYERGGLSEAAGHAAAGVLPMVGPLAAEIGEQAGAGDIAGAAGKTFGLLAGPKIAKEVIKAPLRMPGVVAKLEQGAASRVADVMSPKASNQMARRMGAKAEKIAPEILKDNRGGWSRAALQKQLLGKLESAEGALDTATDERLAARAVDTQPVLEALAEKRRALTSEAVDASSPEQRVTTRQSALVDANGKPIDVETRTAQPYGRDVVPAPNQPRVGVLDQATREIEQLGPTSRYEPLRRMRGAYDGPAKIVYNPSLVDDFLKKTGEAKGAADVTGALREALAKADPATAEANAQYALYKSATDILEAASQIEKAKPKVGRQIMARLTATVFGAHAGGPTGAAAGYILGPTVDALVNSGFTTKLKTAQLMQGIADAARKGEIGAVSSLTHRLQLNAAKARVAAVAVGRQKELAGQE